MTTSPYQPVARRPIAAWFRRSAQRSVAACVRGGVHPDLISYASVVAALAGAACLVFAAAHPWLLLLTTLCIYVRLWLNMLDGMVALAAGKASRWGELVNDLPDRVSDVILFAAVAHCGLASPTSGYLAAVVALLVAYVGLFGQALGGPRGYGGVMSKPWRMVALHAGAWCAFADLVDGSPDARILASAWTWLDLACAVVVLGGGHTVGSRLRAIRRFLAAEEAIDARRT